MSWIPVLAPVVTWRINDRVSLTVDYQNFSRRETPPFSHIKPNIEVVALPPASGILSATGVLVRPDNSDYGFLSYYPLSRKFNYVSNNDHKLFVSVLDLATRMQVATIPMPRGTKGITTSPDGKRVVAMDLARPEITVIDTATDSVLERIALANTTDPA